MAVPEPILKRFDKLSDEQMQPILEPPRGPVRIILDTDTAYRSWVEGLVNLGKDPADVKFVPPDEGMELSYQEILTIYDTLALDPGDRVYRGSPGYLTSLDEPIRSPAAEHIIERALAASDRSLYVDAQCQYPWVLSDDPLCCAAPG